jgi:hypothetical protein
MKKRVKRREPGNRKCTQRARDKRYSFYEMDG